MRNFRIFIFLLLIQSLLSGLDYDVCLDPGHTGRSDPGAQGLNGAEQPDESDFNLYIAEAAEDELMWYGKTVLMTRHVEDTFPPPTRLDQVKRAKIANGQRRNDCGFMGFCYCAVSIHCNADTNYSPAHGTETYFAYYYGQGRLLAQFVQDSMYHQIAGAPYANNRGLKWKGHPFY